jgi:hypothetical protein
MRACESLTLHGIVTVEGSNAGSSQLSSVEVDVNVTRNQSTEIIHTLRCIYLGKFNPIEIPDQYRRCHSDGDGDAEHRRPGFCHFSTELV